MTCSAALTNDYETLYGLEMRAVSLFFSSVRKKILELNSKYPEGNWMSDKEERELPCHQE